MTLRRLVVLCFLLALSVSLFLPAAAQTETTTTPTPTPTNGTSANTTATATAAPTPVSETGAVDLRVSIGERRVVEGAMFERTRQPVLDIEARATDRIRLVAVRQDNERVAEYRPGKLNFEERVRPVLENERNQMRIIVETVAGASESLSFNYTYDTRIPYLRGQGTADLLSRSGGNRVTLSNGTTYTFNESNQTVSNLLSRRIFVTDSEINLSGKIYDASGARTVEVEHTYWQYRNGPDGIRRTYTRDFNASDRGLCADARLTCTPFSFRQYAPPATMNNYAFDFRDTLDNRGTRSYDIYVDDDEPPTFELSLEETDREQSLVRPTVPDADIEMVDDASDGQGSVRDIIRQYEDEDDTDDNGGSDSSNSDSDTDTEYEIPTTDDCNADPWELDADPVPDEFTDGRNTVQHPIPDHDDFNPKVYGQHYCVFPDSYHIDYFGNPDWPFRQGGPFNVSESSDATEELPNEAMEFERITCGDDCYTDVIYSPYEEDEDNDQAINVELESAPRDSTVNKQIRVTGTISDNAQLRRVTVRVGWHPEEVSNIRGLRSDPAGVKPFRNQRNLTVLSRNAFSSSTTDDEEDNDISCDEEAGGLPGIGTGEVGPLGPDNDPGGAVSICDESNQPVLLYYEQDILEPTNARVFDSRYRTVKLNHTIPLKNRTGKTITNVVEVEAQDFQGHEQRRLALVEKEPLQPTPIITIDRQRTRTTSDRRLNIAGRVFDGLVRTVTVETRKDGSIYDFAEVHNGSTRSDIRIQETLDRPEGPTTVVVRAVDIRGTVHTERLRLDAIRTSTPTETPFQTEAPEESTPADTVTPPEPDTPIPTPTPTTTPASTPSPATNATTTTPSADRGAVFGDSFGFAAVALALVSVAALARRRIV